MARTLASLPAGSRVTDYISLGVVSRAVPREKIDAILAETGKTSIRQRELPAHLVVYYVIALALYMQSSYREVLRCLLEGVQWLTKPGEIVRATGKSGISQARSRLGAEPLRRLYEQVVVPIAPGSRLRLARASAEAPATRGTRTIERWLLSERPLPFREGGATQNERRTSS